MLETVLGLALVTLSTNVASRPPWLTEAADSYKACVYSAIDRQYYSKHFSERIVLSECAGVRRAQVRKAELAAIRASASKEREKLIKLEFSRLDASVWTIVGHLRERRGDAPKLTPNIGR